MAMRKVVRKRRAPRRKMGGKRKGMRKGGFKRKEDYARITEIQETELVAATDAGGDSVGAQMSFTLGDFQRPQEVAHAYKFYRAAHVEMTFIPYFTTAQTAGTVVSRMPQLYYSVDRVGNQWIAPTENEMLERGISPKVFNRKYKLSFRPNLLQIIDLETGQPADGTGRPIGIDVLGAINSIPIFNKWIPTQQSAGYTAVAGNAQIGQQVLPKAVNPYALRYYGAIYNAAIEAQGAGALPVGDVQLKITWEFKGPRALKTNRPVFEPNPLAVTSTTAGAVPNTQPTTYP